MANLLKILNENCLFLIWSLLTVVVFLSITLLLKSSKKRKFYKSSFGISLWGLYSANYDLKTQAIEDLDNKINNLNEKLKKETWHPLKLWFAFLMALIVAKLIFNRAENESKDKKKLAENTKTTGDKQDLPNEKTDVNGKEKSVNGG